MEAQVPFAIPKGFLDPTHLFPCPIQRGFTSAPRQPGAIPDSVICLSLSDDKFNLTRETSGLTHHVVDAPLAVPGTLAWTAFFPAGSINPGNKTAPKGGFGFYLAGPKGDLSFEGATEVLLSYAVYFEPGFDFNLGGKLPGLYGGTTQELAYGCSGGRSDDRNKCFSLRLMWRENGAGEIYGYLPLVPENDDVLCKVPPKSHRNPDYGFSIGRGAFAFVPGEWAVISERVKLNDVGVCNGEVDLWVNGKQAINIRGAVIRDDPSCAFRGAHFQTFFGGSSAPWASPKDQRLLFANITGAIIA